MKIVEARALDVAVQQAAAANAIVSDPNVDPRLAAPHLQRAWQGPELIDATNSEFHPYDGTADKTAWSKADPTGAVMLFDILNKFGTIPVKNKSDRIERALVVASDIKRSADLYYWRFSTLGANDSWKPDFSAYGDHPVSGTREFGLYKSGTVWFAYTRGADRATGEVIDYWSRTTSSRVPTTSGNRFRPSSRSS